MGKTLLRAQRRRRNPRHVLPCKRFCSCCSEDSCRTSILKNSQQKKRETGLVESFQNLKTFKNNLQLHCNRSQFRSVRRVEVRPVTVNVVRLSKKVLDELSVKGSVRVCNVGNEAERNSCLLSPTRRLRSTPVRPFVRQNVMDKLRGLNADWRNTSYPSDFCNPSGSAGAEYVQESRLSMKTLFLENLSICKKSSTTESIKEEVKMSQDENRANLINQQKNSTKPTPSVKYMPYSDMGRTPRLLTFQSKVVPMNGRIKSCHSLLGERIQPDPELPGCRQNFRSLLSKTSLTRPAVSSKKTIVTVPRIPQKPDLPPPTVETVPDGPLASLKFTPLPPDLFLKKTTTTDPVDPLKPAPTSPQKFNLKPKILEAGSRRVRNTTPLTPLKPSIESNFLKNTHSTSKQNLSTLNRRKQSLSAQPSSFSSHPLEHRSPFVPASRHDSSNHRIDLETTVAVIPQQRPHLKNLKPRGTPNKSLEKTNVLTIVVSDSSEDEHIKKDSPAKPYMQPQAHVPKSITPMKKTAKKRTSVPKSRKRKTNSKTTSESQNGNNRSNVNVDREKTPVRKRKIPARKNSQNLINSSSEGEEISSDSEVEAPKYVSRTGRSIAVSSGCRSCPGCKIDVRKGKSGPKPASKKSEIESKTKRSTRQRGRVIPNKESPPLMKPGSPISVIVQGVTSSESEDDFTEANIRRMLEEVKRVANVHKDRAELTKNSLKSYSTTPVESSDLLIAGSSSAPIPAQTKLHESDNHSTDVDMMKTEVVGLKNQPHSTQGTPDIQCYVSHYDSNGTLLLDEVETSEEDSPEYIDYKRHRPMIEIHDRIDMKKPQNERAHWSGQEQSSAVVNTGTEAICRTELVDSSEMIGNTPVERVIAGPDNCEDGSSRSNSLELSNPEPLPDGCHQNQNNVTTALEDDPAANDKKCLEAVGSEQQNYTNTCHETQNCTVQSLLEIRDSEVDDPQSKDLFCIPLKNSNRCDRDILNMGQHSSQDDSNSARNILSCTNEFQELSLVPEHDPDRPPNTHHEPSLPDLTHTTILSSQHDHESLSIVDQIDQRGASGCDDVVHVEATTENDDTPEAAEDCRRPSHKCSTPYDDPQAEFTSTGGTEVQNGTSNLPMALPADYCRMPGDKGPLEILILEGCPSCQGDSKPDEIFLHASQEGSDKSVSAPIKHNLAASSTPLDSSCGADSKAQQEYFYTAMSDLLSQCLNNVVEEVKLNNREVIIKKVDKSSGKASDMDAEQAGFAAEDLESIAPDLNLPVSLNPRLTIKKLPFTPRDCNSNETETPHNQDTDSFDKSEDEFCERVLKTPTKSLYERKGFPTPIKRLNPRVLTVIKYNDLEIYNDEPSWNDPPESDRLLCVTSKGVRFELNAEELANIENVLNDLHDKSSASDEEIDDLVIYNDEPPLNPVCTKRLRFPFFEGGEDLEDLVIDNDAPPLNEDIEVDNHIVDDPECMVISSDDEVVVDSGVASEVVSRPVHSVPANPDRKPKRKVFRRKRKSCRSLKAPSVAELLRSQMEYSVNPLEVVSPMDDIAYDQLVDVVASPPSWNPLSSSECCREVLYQPQVFNLQGQPLLFDTPTLQTHQPFIGAPVSSDVSSTSLATFDLTQTSQDYTESVDTNDSDTATASECADDVEVISSPEKSNSSVHRAAFSYENGCDTKDVVQTIDTDSDSDVVVLQGPNNLHPVDNRLGHFPTSAIPSAEPALRRNLEIVPRDDRPRTIPAHARPVRTANGEIYYVLVVPPNTRRSNNIQSFPR